MMDNTSTEGSTTSPVSAGTDQAKRIGRDVAERAFSTIDTRKSEWLGSVDGVLSKLEGLPVGADGLVGRAKELLDGVKTRPTRELIDDVQLQARQRPGLFMLGALAVGFLAGRALKDVGGGA